jgi:hypothetical protein
VRCTGSGDEDIDVVDGHPRSLVECSGLDGRRPAVGALLVVCAVGGDVCPGVWSWPRAVDGDVLHDD